MLADVLTPYPVCLSRSVTLDISSINTHTHREHMPSVAQMSIVWSDPTTACHSLWAC